MSHLADRAAREIVDRHGDFQALGRGGGSRADFPFEAAMSPDFTIVTTEGATIGRDAVFAQFDGLAAGVGADFAIQVSDIVVSWEGADAALLLYTETQWKAGRETRRRSSALFLADDGAPHGVAWQHLQETWIKD